MNTTLSMSARNHGALFYHLVFTFSSKSVFYIQNMTNSGLLWHFTLLYFSFQYLQTKVPKQVFAQSCCSIYLPSELWTHLSLVLSPEGCICFQGLFVRAEPTQL